MSVQLLAGEIRNRIVEVRKMRFGDVAANPRNPKYHPANQRNAIRGSVRELGFGTVPIVYVSQRLGGKVAWGDGHLRGNEFADYVGDVALTDYTDEEIDKFLLYADPIAAMAEYESQQLDSLLKSVQTGDEALQAMLAGLAQEAGLYRPELSPTMANSTVTADDVTTTAERLNSRFDSGVDEQVEMLCPHCGETFFIKKTDL